MASAAKMAASVTRLKGGVVVAREPRRKGRLGVQRQQSLNGNFKQRGTTRVEAKHVNMTCPICMDVLEYEEGREDKDEKGPITLPPKKVSCSSCNWSKDTESDTFFDLTVLPSNAIRGNDPSSSEILNAVTGLFQDPSEASESNTYKEKLWSVSQLFQSPVISYVYERGWRQVRDKHAKNKNLSLRNSISYLCFSSSSSWLWRCPSNPTIVRVSTGQVSLELTRSLRFCKSCSKRVKLGHYLSCSLPPLC